MHAIYKSLNTDSLKKDHQFLLKAVFITAVLIAVSTFSLMAQNESDAYRIETYNVDDGVQIEAQTSGGHISVYGGNGDKVEVQIFVRKKGRYLDSNNYDITEDFDLEVRKDGNRVIASAKRRKAGGWGWNNNNVSVSYIFKVPNESNVDLKTSGGHLEVAMIEGNLDMNTSGGHITLNEIRGDIEASTSGGHIEMDDLKGQVSVRTSGGHIDLNNGEGIFEMRTSGGHIDIDRVYGKVSARTSGGRIKAELLAVTGDIELRTSGGSVELSMPSDVGADLEIKGTRVRANLVNFSGSQTKTSIEGSMNGGGNKVVLKTSGGTARLELN